MLPEVRKYLLDMSEAVSLIESFCVGKTDSDLREDKLLRSGIYYQFAILGEALSQLRKLDNAVFEEISESSRIVAFRNQIIHGYQVIRDEVTWQIVQDKLPILKAELKDLLS